uniref:Uncharacterized protein n=1 Tax=Arundo donax TaxID=35708 RepID=A0A0A9DH96_ARUDO
MDFLHRSSSVHGHPSVSCSRAMSLSLGARKSILARAQRILPRFGSSLSSYREEIVH